MSASIRVRPATGTGICCANTPQKHVHVRATTQHPHPQNKHERPLLDATKKNPKQNTRLGFLWTRRQGCRGMGCRPIQSKVTNHTPIGFNSRSRAPDLIRAGSVSALTVAVCPKRLWGVQPSHTAPSTCAQTASVARNRPSEISAATSPTTTRTIPAS